LHSTLELPSILNRESTLREWKQDPRGMRALAPFYPQLNDQMQAKFGGDDREQIGMDPMGFLMDMPMPGLLHFLGITKPKSPEERVDELLVEVYSLA
jgi:beta-glucosidase